MEKFRLAVRKIYYKPVTPSCDIIELDFDTWMKFLHGNNRRRVSIVCRATGKENMIGYTKEIAWFPLDKQNLVVEVQNKESLG